MCGICGCGSATVGELNANPEKKIEPHDHGHDHGHGAIAHSHADAHEHHSHAHEHDVHEVHSHEVHSHENHSHSAHSHETGSTSQPPSPVSMQNLDFSKGLAGVHIPGMSEEKIIRIERDILSKNNAYAEANRAYLKKIDLLALNFVSSPGSGKTALLTKTIEDLKPRLSVAVIEGDQQTSNDAERIRATGAPAIQVNTGKGCHLDAHMVGHALEKLPLQGCDVLFIENVGNLVCPAAFDLGEAHKIVVLSVTEGEDKPLKYPDMFAAADLLLLNKTDLLPHLDFDVGACLAAALKVNPNLQTLCVSARTGEGMQAFYAWISARVAHSQIHADTGRASQAGHTTIIAGRG